MCASVCVKESERAADSSFFPGWLILTICEGLEAHLAAVFAKAGDGPRPHLHHVHRSRPEGLHARRVGLASQDGGVNLLVVLKEAARAQPRQWKQISCGDEPERSVHVQLKMMAFPRCCEGTCTRTEPPEGSGCEESASKL